MDPAAADDQDLILPFPASLPPDEFAPPPEAADPDLETFPAPEILTAGVGPIATAAEEAWDDLLEQPRCARPTYTPFPPLPQAARPGPPVLQHLGLRLPDSCMIYRVTATLPALEPGQGVVVQIQEREVLTKVVFASSLDQDMPQDSLWPGPIRRVLRVLDDHARHAWEQRQDKEWQARKFCKELIRRLELPMKLSRVGYQAGGSKAVFHFTAENRVDFRELVRQLSRELRVRVEMRQIGVRDETRMVNGQGPCGRLFCCAGHLEKFHPVSVRMAKNQDLSLNPDSISGGCGRLMCCLGYENATYDRLRQDLPPVNSILRTPEGQEVKVRAVHPIRGMVEVVDPEGQRRQWPVAQLGLPPGGIESPPSAAGEEAVQEQEEASASIAPEAAGEQKSPARDRRPSGKACVAAGADGDPPPREGERIRKGRRGGSRSGRAETAAPVGKDDVAGETRGRRERRVRSREETPDGPPARRRPEPREPAAAAGEDHPVTVEAENRLPSVEGGAGVGGRRRRRSRSGGQRRQDGANAHRPARQPKPRDPGAGSPS
ncbi:MAG: hypothetical protein HQL82_17200 [Magnetococcales bacterium]|nr:hypothetical protein [Magnetococcales bacterium]